MTEWWRSTYSWFLFKQAEQERLANVIRAEGEANAADVISKAIKKHGAGLIELRRIEAAKDISTTLSQARNVTYLPDGSKNGSNLLLNLNNA